MYGIIYKITNKLNSKIYMGQTVHTAHERWLQHVQSSINPSPEHAYRKLTLAIQKYGKDAFQVEQIDSADSFEELNQKEIYWIAYYQSLTKGYNMTAGGALSRSYDYKSHPNKEQIHNKISSSKMGGKNPQAVAVKCKNVISQEEIHFASAADAMRFFKPDATSALPVISRCRGNIRYLLNGEWLCAYEQDDYPNTESCKNKGASCARARQVQVTAGDQIVATYDTFTKAEEDLSLPKGVISRYFASKGVEFEYGIYKFKVLT